MKIKLKNKITALLGATLSFLTACQSDDILTPHYTVGEENNAIVLGAGIIEGGEGVQTRAVDGNHDADNIYGGGHKPFSTSKTTQLRLRVDGTWLGKELQDNLVSQTTTATVGSVTGKENKHNVVSFSTTTTPVEQLYWDDYGTADPNNKGAAEKGREKGLTIYGVAVEGLSSAPAVSNWNALEWTVSNDQSASGIWGNEDLLISNNIKADKDGTLKFDDVYPTIKEGASNLLEFTHAMSKITVNLIAGDGFPTEGVGATTVKFAAAPQVILTSNLYGKTTETEWVYTKGSVNVLTGVVSSPGELKQVTMVTTSTSNTGYTVVKEALIVPGSTFGDKVSEVYPQVLSILADGNRYYVSSEKMRAAIAAAINASKHENSYAAQQGKNYIFNIKLNKTSIDVTATIKDWVNVAAAEDVPIINFSKCYGQTGTEFGIGFSFYRSSAVAGSYTEDGNSATVSFADSKYTMSPQLYWPDHNTHYFFRGVWPKVGETDGPASIADGKTIAVNNCAYVEGKHPSDLMIGMPRKADGTPDETCKAGHKTDDKAAAGICATDAAEGAIHENEGLIHMNFQYVMSKVQFSLKSSGTVAAGNSVDLSHATIEIIGGYNSGMIQLSDGKHAAFGDSNKGVYTLNKLTSPETGFTISTLDAVVPQQLGDDAKIRITVKDASDNILDVYESQLNKIKVKTDDDSGALITEWVPGTYYKYELDILKTAINITATLKDWVTVDASDNVWF